MKNVCETDITQFYKVDQSTILGEGISGSVRLCTHIAVSFHYNMWSICVNH